MSKRYILVNVLISLIIFCSFFVRIYKSNPQYLFQEDNFHKNSIFFLNPDAKHYYIMGKILLEKGIFSRDLKNPEKNPDIVRTPLYPIILASIEYFSKKTMFIYIFHEFLYLLSIIFLMKLIYLLTKSNIVAFIGGLFMAINVACYAYVFLVMAEISFNFFTIISLYYFCFFCKRSVEEKKSSWFLLICLIALASGLGVLVRHATKIQVLIYLFIILFYTKYLWKKKIAISAILLLIYSLIVFPWIYRNHKEFNLWCLSNTQEINLINFAGGGAYSLKHNVSLLEAQNLISEEFDIPNNADACNIWTLDPPLTPYELDKKYKKVIFKVLLKYPKYLLIGSVIGVIKSHIAHNTAIFAKQSEKIWNHTGFDNFVKGNFSFFFNNLFKNDSFMIVLFIYQYIYLFVLYTMFFIGSIFVLMKIYTKKLNNKPAYLTLIITYLYFLLMVVVVGSFAYTRHRMMVELLYYIFAAHGFYLINVFFIKKIK